MNKAIHESGDNRVVLVCIRECEIPELGAWKVGDRVTNPETAKKLADHPNFKVSDREE